MSSIVSSAASNSNSVKFDPNLDRIFSRPSNVSDVYNHRNANIINPYLDVMQTRSSHIIADGRETERKFTIEPVLLPDLEHTGICPSLHETERLLFYPSSKKNTNIRANLNATLRASSLLEYHPQHEEPSYLSQANESNDHQFSHMRVSTSDVITARSQAKSILSMMKTGSSGSFENKNKSTDNNSNNNNNNQNSSIEAENQEDIDLDQSHILHNNIHGDDGLLLQETGTDFNDLPYQEPITNQLGDGSLLESSTSTADSSRSYVHKIRHLMEPSPPNLRHLTTSSDASSNSYNHYVAIAKKNNPLRNPSILPPREGYYDLNGIKTTRKNPTSDRAAKNVLSKMKSQNQKMALLVFNDV